MTEEVYSDRDWDGTFLSSNRDQRTSCEDGCGARVIDEAGHNIQRRPRPVSLEVSNCKIKSVVGERCRQSWIQIR